MSESRKWTTKSSRRKFLRGAAGITAGSVLSRQPLWAQGASSAAPPSLVFPKIDPKLMITPEQALDWNVFKAECGPTYAGSAGWKRFTDFLIVEDAGVRRRRSRLRRHPVRPLHRRRLARSAHAHARLRRSRSRSSSPTARRCRSSPRYGMTSGSTPPEGITAPMLYLRPRASAGGSRDRREDPGLPDRAAAGAALHQLLPRQLHAHRLRVAFARQVAAAVHAAAGERHARPFTAAGSGVS